MYLPTERELNDLDMTVRGKEVIEPEYRGYYEGVSGREHYRLLVWMSHHFDGSLLFDIGTYKGCSALALSHNPTVRVKSYDIGNFRRLHSDPTNVEYLLGDATEDGDIRYSPFIFLDTAHDGTFERKFHQHLETIQWKGILMLDDIHLNHEMKDYWNDITQPKEDVSRLGHWSGTGLVFFE